jgi:hypothetical protein
METSTARPLYGPQGPLTRRERSTRAQRVIKAQRRAQAAVRRRCGDCGEPLEGEPHPLGRHIPGCAYGPDAVGAAVVRVARTRARWAA